MDWISDNCVEISVTSDGPSASAQNSLFMDDIFGIYHLERIDPKGKAMQFEMNKIILSKGLAIIINVICFCFVVWKSIECFVKYSKAPKGTNVGVEYTGHQIFFPTFIVCGVYPNENNSIRWNQTHLHQCGIDEYEILIQGV